MDHGNILSRAHETMVTHTHTHYIRHGTRLLSHNSTEFPIYGGTLATPIADIMNTRLGFQE